MAKEKEKVNKSELIRSILGSHPKFTAKEVVAKLKENGIEATEGLVYQVKQAMNGKQKKGKPGRKPATATAPAATKAAPSSNGALSVGDSIAEIAKRVGGYAALKEIVDTLQ